MAIITGTGNPDERFGGDAADTILSADQFKFEAAQVQLLIFDPQGIPDFV